MAYATAEREEIVEWRRKTMSVMVVCQIKNAGYWVKRYIKCIEDQENVSLRIVCMYGESGDATYSILKHWSQITQHRVEVYREPHLPPQERHNYALARIKRDFQTLFLEGDEDYYFVCDPDNVKLPENLITRLIADEKDVVAPYVWTEGRRRPTFFDTYGFRLDKCKFHPYDPPGHGGDKPVEVDCVGNCYLATRKAMMDGVYTNPFPHLQFCNGLREKGYKIWADPTLNVTHVDLEKYGIYHYPPAIALSTVEFINSKRAKVTNEHVRYAIAYQAVDDYNAWIGTHEPLTFLWLRQFDSGRPLITASYKVFNEAEYLAYSLESVYPYVDRIDIVEGAVEKNMHCANVDGSSVDDTVRIIEDFPDPDLKIRLVQGKWKNKEQVQRKLLELCEARWMMFIDGDELYLPQDLEHIKGFCGDNLDGRVVYAIPGRTLNFWHDWGHIAYSLNKLSPWGRNAAMHPFLIWRDLPGLNFNFFHTFPLDGMGRNMALDPGYEDKRVVLNNVFLYHYGHAKSPLNIYNKLQYFQNRGTGEVKGEVEEDMWFSGVMPSDFVIREFRGEPPPPLKAHPLYGKVLIEVTEKKPVYKFERIGDE